MSKKYVVAIMSMILAIGLMAGCSKKPGAAGGAKEEAKPNVYAPAGAGFSVVLPADMKEMKKESANIDTPMGPKIMEMYQAMDKGVMYLASETKLTGIKLDLKAAVEDGLKGGSEGGTILNREDLKIGVNPALKARFKTKENGKDVFVLFFLAYANETQFQLQVRAADEKALDTPEVQTYVNSFKLTGSNPAAVPEAASEKPVAGKK